MCSDLMENHHHEVPAELITPEIITIREQRPTRPQQREQRPQTKLKIQKETNAKVSLTIYFLVVKLYKC